MYIATTDFQVPTPSECASRRPIAEPPRRRQEVDCRPDRLRPSTAVPQASFRMSGSSPCFFSSSLCHSIGYPQGTRKWLFSENSPKGISTSPQSVISAILGLISLASAAVLHCTRSPLWSRTIGPSSSSHGVTTQAFPGLSIFSWVPSAGNSSSMYMVAGE